MKSEIELRGFHAVVLHDAEPNAHLVDMQKLRPLRLHSSRPYIWRWLDFVVAVRLLHRARQLVTGNGSNAERCVGVNCTADMKVYLVAAGHVAHTCSDNGIVAIYLKSKDSFAI